jgi:hypothetical protein
MNVSSATQGEQLTRFAPLPNGDDGSCMEAIRADVLVTKRVLAAFGKSNLLHRYVCNTHHNDAAARPRDS